MSYVTYNNFKLGNNNIKKYRSILTEDVLAGLSDIKTRCEKHEKNFYYSKHGRRNGLPENWKDIIKKDISGPESANSFNVKAVAANAYLNSNNYQDFKEKLLEGLRKGSTEQLSFLELEDINEPLNKTIIRLYNTLTTRLNNQTIEITKTTIKGKKSSTIEGWLIEIMQGALDRKKLSTSGVRKYSVIADYIVPTVGLEETKRGLKNQNTILNSQFHLGSFTTTSMMPGKNWEELQEQLINVFINIVRELTTNTHWNIKTIRKHIFDNFNILIGSYLGARLLNGLGGSKEIFYFGSGPTILLASEFIEGVIEYSKISSSGYAELSNTIGYTQLSRLGLDTLITELGITSSQMGIDFSSKGVKDKIESYIKKESIKLGPFFKKGKFDLWYGKK